MGYFNTTVEGTVQPTGHGMAAITTPTITTFADLLDRIGHVPAERIRFRPAPGTASVDDVLDVRRRERKLCELVDGVLVEKPMGYFESILAFELGALLLAHVKKHQLGVVSGAGGTVELMPELVRIPDLAFISWARFPGGRMPADLTPIPRLVPGLAVEVLSRSNTPAEMQAKREDYFAAGVRLVWEVDLPTRSVMVYSSPTDFVTRTTTDSLDGLDVLPGFILPVAQIFESFDR